MAWTFGNAFVVLLIFVDAPLKADGACTLPLADGEWLSSTRGTWTVSGGGAQISNFQADLTASLNTATLNCTQTGSTDTQYILSTYFEIFTGLFITVYTCLDIQTVQSPYLYNAYFVTPTDTSTGEKFTSDLTSVCSNTGYATPTNVMMILQSGSESSVTINCDDVILGNYSVTYTDSDAVATGDVLMDSCNDTTKLNFDNVTTGANLAFTSGNLLQCLYSVASGSDVYVFTYNNDSSVDSTKTYGFACWVFAYITGGTAGTVHPQECLAEQTSASVAYPGQKFEFAPYYVCPLNVIVEEEEGSGLAGWLIAVIVLAVLLVLAMLVVVIAYLLWRRQAQRGDEEKGRQGTPENIPDEDDYMSRMKKKLQDHAISDARDPKYKQFRKKEDGYDSGFDEKGQLKDKVVREKSFELHEIKKGRGKKLIPGKPFKKTTDPTKSETSPRQEADSEHSGDKKPKVLDEEPEVLPIQKGKVDGDATLEKIKKERERKGKEKEEKKKQQQMKKTKIKDDKPEEEPDNDQPVIKTVREDSASDEYETDESEREERKRRLEEKKRRLQAAAYVPPEGVTDATVVGKKKQRNRLDGDETDEKGGHLVSRDEQEKQDKKRKSRAKAMRSLASKRKFRPASAQGDSSDSDPDVAAKKNKRRRAGGARERGAPYLKQYNEKKDIERELDDIDYWQERSTKAAGPLDDTVFEDDNEEHPKPLNVAPAETTDRPPSRPHATKSDDVTRRELVTQEEEALWDKPLPELEIEIGPDGQLPEGYYRDNDGNIVRESDGKIIATAEVVRLIELKKRMHVFGLPRLIRNTDGRPLGGYKDDIFGPTAEWDWGEVLEENEDRKSEMQRAASGKQVGFTVADGTSVPTTPLTEFDYNQLKGRQLGSAERELLQQRLFEQQQKQRAEADADKRPPVFHKRNCGLQPEPVYLEKAQVQRLDQDKARRSNSMRTATPGGSAMVMRSDTFDDGRTDNRKQNLKRNSKLRASWSASDSFVRDGIPEETELENLESASKNVEKKRNLGSDDEFVYVGIGNKAPSHARREKFGYPPAREETLMSDVSMRTAPDSPRRPRSDGDRRSRRCLGELYKDQKYFQYYLDTEHLPTRAAQETRGLASHGLDFLQERAEYWGEVELPLRLPPSDLAFHISRGQTLYTIADSGLDSALSSELGRPNSADDADENITSSRMSKRESSREWPGRITIPTQRSDVSQAATGGAVSREPPTGRSEPSKSPSKLEKTLSVERERTRVQEGLSTAKDSPRKAKGEVKIKEASKKGNVLTMQEIDKDV